MEKNIASGIRAYIDAANLHRGVEGSGWHLDYRRFRSWLRQKYGVEVAHIFIGLMAKHEALYRMLEQAGYALTYKEVIYGGDGRPKGNCDADLVLRAARDHFEVGMKGAIIVTSDGDYAPLVRFYQEKGVTCTILSPSPRERCSVLLKRTAAPIVYLGEVRRKICRKPS